MLRYDSCYPASEGDSALLREAVEGGDVLTVVEIELQTDRPDVSPSDRWRSHCWAVIQEEVCR
jgi:hypothetical protein